jgi:hypothetical protein
MACFMSCTAKIILLPGRAASFTWHTTSTSLSLSLSSTSWSQSRLALGSFKRPSHTAVPTLQGPGSSTLQVRPASVLLIRRSMMLGKTWTTRDLQPSGLTVRRNPCVTTFTNSRQFLSLRNDASNCTFMWNLRRKTTVVSLVIRNGLLKILLPTKHSLLAQTYAARCLQGSARAGDRTSREPL